MPSQRRLDVDPGDTSGKQGVGHELQQSEAGGGVADGHGPRGYQFISPYVADEV